MDSMTPRHTLACMSILQELMRRSGDSTASITRTVGGIALAGSHAAIREDTPQADPSPQYAADGSYNGSTAAGSHAYSPDASSHSNAAMYPNNREMLSPERSMDIDGDYEERIDVSSAAAELSANRNAAGSDAPETVPADGLGPQLSPGSPNGQSADPAAAAADSAAAYRRKDNRLGRPTSAVGRNSDNSAGGFTFNTTRIGQIGAAAHDEESTAGHASGLPHSIAAFRPDTVPGYQPRSAANAVAAGTLPAGVTSSSKQGVSSQPRADVQQPGSEGLSVADWPLGLPPRPVQVCVHNMNACMA